MSPKAAQGLGYHHVDRNAVHILPPVRVIPEVGAPMERLHGGKRTLGITPPRLRTGVITNEHVLVPIPSRNLAEQGAKRLSHHPTGSDCSPTMMEMSCCE